jgi:hypothetical protein
MKSASIRVALFTAVVLASPALIFAGGQPNKMHAVSKAEMQDRTGVSRNVNQGKGTGISRQQVVAGANTNSAALRATGSDTAFSK